MINAALSEAAREPRRRRQPEHELKIPHNACRGCTCSGSRHGEGEKATLRLTGPQAAQNRRFASRFGPFGDQRFAERMAKSDAPIKPGFVGTRPLSSFSMPATARPRFRFRPALRLRALAE
jgi:hypothetical protein